MARLMEITTPLGGDVLLFHRMYMREELSRLGECRLDLLSARGDIDVDEILGKNVTVRVALADDSVRHFNGYVIRFAQRGRLGRYHRYVADVRPWLWFLTRTADCRVFQEKTVPDIVKAVFGDHAAADFKLELSATYRKWTYCVQYRETDFNFVSRLMEEEGIYYYVRHSDGHNTVVLTDSTSAHTTAPGYDKIPFIAPEALIRPEMEHIASWEFSREIQPGVYVHDDYDLERPGVELKTQKARPRRYSPSDYEVYDYPGHYLQRADGEHYADVRIDELATLFETAEGTANARGVTVGSLFTLTGCPRADQNREHLVVSTTHELEYGAYEGLPEPGGASFDCRFTALSSQQQFRPRRFTAKPFVQGPQTAVVVGPSGDEIHTDKFGRVKVQFHWDRYGKKDANSSCWIRVSHPWAGKGWGSVATPRIGQEVVVDFLEGDPDQPIITGRVYNAECEPPFGFPAGAVISGVKSNTHKGSGYNEMSLDDTKGKEKITIHAQYDMNTTVEHDQTTTVHNNRTDRIDVDDSEGVGGNQKLHVEKNQTIDIDVNRTETVGGDETITIKGNRTRTVEKNEAVTVNQQRTHSVGANESLTIGAAQEISVGSSQTVDVGASQTTTVGASQSNSIGENQSNTIGGNQSTSVGKNLSTTVGKDESRSVAGARSTAIAKDDELKVEKKLIVNVGDSVMLKAGNASITLKKDGTIVIKGKDITLDGSGKINVKAAGDIVMKGSKIKQN